jgi:hypothetical protein
MRPMERLTTESDLPADRRKPKIWDRIKRRNSSSPSLHKMGIKNWSTRSLPRLGSLGSSSIGNRSPVSPKSSPPWTPIVEQLSIAEDVTLPESDLVKDYFTTLPNEVKLQIFSLLPVKAIARASTVLAVTIQSNCRCVKNGTHCALTEHCSRQSIHAHFIGISPLLCWCRCCFKQDHFCVI